MWDLESSRPPEEQGYISVPKERRIVLFGIYPGTEDSVNFKVLFQQTGGRRALILGIPSNKLVWSNLTDLLEEARCHLF